jgi:fatty-acyl-CoA synthase/long-chain acyl-CoA synthetase
VTSVVDDKKRGLLAQVTMNGASEAEVGKTLDVYTFGWQAA